MTQTKTMVRIKLPETERELRIFYDRVNRPRTSSKVWQMDLYAPGGECLEGPFTNLRLLYQWVVEVDPRVQYYEYLRLVFNSEIEQCFGWSAAPCGEVPDYWAVPIIEEEKEETDETEQEGDGELDAR